jgi:SUMO ligase MMS21 Smc5/6 complex component
MEQQVRQEQEQVLIHRAQVGVECPTCHVKQFMEIQLDRPVNNSPAVDEIRRQLEAWIASRCPDHLGPVLKTSMN